MKKPMKVYCKQVPLKWRNAITPMKSYDVIFQEGSLKVIEDDEGDLITISLQDCQFLGGGSWAIYDNLSDKECN